MEIGVHIPQKARVIIFFIWSYILKLSHKCRFLKKATILDLVQAGYVCILLPFLSHSASLQLVRSSVGSIFAFYNDGSQITIFRIIFTGILFYKKNALMSRIQIIIQRNGLKAKCFLKMNIFFNIYQIFCHHLMIFFSTYTK